MSVVEKIASFNIHFILGIGNPNLQQGASFNHNALTTIKGNIDIFVTTNNSLDSVYQAVVEFIKWYNLNK